MSTVPLGENPYLYRGGPTVPLRQQKTGNYSANTFGNRVFYTPEGRLPDSTLAPGLAPTPGALLRQNLSGAGLAGAAVGGALQAQAVYSQGGGLFEGLGSGVGTAAGAVGGQFAGAAAGASVGGAVGSAVPGVGNVAGAGAGTVVGAIGGGLTGGAIGGSVGGGIGRAIDDFFWPNPAQPEIGIPDQPGTAEPLRNPAGYPNEFPAEAAGSGPIVAEGIPFNPVDGGDFSPFGGVTIRFFSPNNSQWIEAGVLSYSVTATPELAQFFGPNYGVINYTNCQGGNSNPGLDMTTLTVVSGSACSPGAPYSPDSLGTPAEREPNPSRPPSRPLRDPYYPAGSGTPSPRPTDSPWPARAADPVADAEPLGNTSPFKAPEPGPNFAPTPNPLVPIEAEPLSPTGPARPTDPLNPIGPSRPLTPDDEKTIRPTPFFIPIPISTAPINPPDFKNPDVPVSIPVNFRQPATTPTGDPGQLIDPTKTIEPNPNTRTEIEPVQQPARIEEGTCCIPPANPDIIKRLEQIKKGIGVDGLPASVVDQIAKDNPGQIQIGSLAELHLWQVQQLDGVLGKWPVGIPIPTPAGTTTVGMPNMAEAVAEMVGMMVSQQITATQILNTSSRAMVQAGSATQQAHLAHLTAKANADFLGYESRPNAVDMPLTYSPGKDPTDGLLNESVAKVQGFQNTDNTDIKAILAELLQAAAIIRAVYWRRLDPKGDLKSQIRQNVRGQSDFIDEAAAGGGDNSDWEAYLKQVEEGFRGATGDATPYNRNPEEGPQIKDRSPGKDGN